jgi:hypothetical protein
MRTSPTKALIARGSRAQEKDRSDDSRAHGCTTPRVWVAVPHGFHLVDHRSGSRHRGDRAAHPGPAHPRPRVDRARVSRGPRRLFDLPDTRTEALDVRVALALTSDHARRGAERAGGLCRPTAHATRRAARSCNDGWASSTAGISTASPSSSRATFDHTLSCGGGSAGPVAIPSTA